jgi:hypothetical protein
MMVMTSAGFDFTTGECAAWMQEAGFGESYIERLTEDISMLSATK